MAAGRLQGLSCFFTFSVLGLLGVSFHRDVEATNEEYVTHKKAGETVEFKSNLLSAEGVAFAEWKHGKDMVMSTNKEVKEIDQFKGRTYLNPQNFSLIVRNLTPQDSGKYLFVSEVDDNQRPTVEFTLHVHEPITEEPVVSEINVTRDALNRSCTVFLECSSDVPGVSFNWSVGSERRSGSKLQHVIRAQDGEITFTCTVSNYFFEKSSSIRQNCSNDTFTDTLGSDHLVLVAAGGGGALLALIIVGIVVGVCCSKRKQTAESNTPDQTVYDEIADVSAQNRSTMPCSVYEAVETTISSIPVTPKVQTVYDKIQLQRVKQDLTSPYQRVS